MQINEMFKIGEAQQDMASVDLLQTSRQRVRHGIEKSLKRFSKRNTYRKRLDRTLFAHDQMRKLRFVFHRKITYAARKRNVLVVQRPFDNDQAIGDGRIFWVDRRLVPSRIRDWSNAKSTRTHSNEIRIWERWNCVPNQTPPSFPVFPTWRIE